jgi:hypothetical protein
VTSQPAGRTIGDVVASMRERLELMPSGQQARRDFLSTYVRTTEAVAAAAEAGTFEDPAWVERWDVAFADLYLTALDADLAGSPGVSRPWRLAFAVPQDLPALRNVLVGINAHINYDLPQSLLAVISDEAFADPVLLARRRRDHGRIDGILSARVSAEDSHLATRTARSALDRVLTPVNRLASRSLLREAREKVWHNTTELHRARLEGPMAYAARLAELELLSAARVADLLASGQVLLRLAVGGFGVTLPPPA